MSSRAGLLLAAALAAFGAGRAALLALGEDAVAARDGRAAGEIGALDGALGRAARGARGFAYPDGSDVLGNFRSAQGGVTRSLEALRRLAAEPPPFSEEVDELSEKAHNALRMCSNLATLRRGGMLPDPALAGLASDAAAAARSAADRLLRKLSAEQSRLSNSRLLAWGCAGTCALAALALLGLALGRSPAGA